jgi:hypothetical protein
MGSSSISRCISQGRRRRRRTVLIHKNILKKYFLIIKKINSKRMQIAELHCCS